MCEKASTSRTLLEEKIKKLKAAADKPGEKPTSSEKAKGKKEKGGKDKRKTAATKESNSGNNISNLPAPVWFNHYHCQLFSRV